MESRQQFAAQMSGGEGTGAPGPAQPSPPPYAPPGAPAKEWSRDPLYRSDPRRKSPALACILSMMPGLGQIYIGYYQRGFIHVLVAGSVMALLAAEAVPPLVPLLGIFIGFFWLYNMVDAFRRATLYNIALQGGSVMPLPEDFEMSGLRGSLLGGSVLVGLGLIMLMQTRFGMSLDWVEDWWPMAPILFGAYLVYKSVRGRAESS